MIYIYSDGGKTILMEDVHPIVKTRLICFPLYIYIYIYIYKALFLYIRLCLVYLARKKIIT